MRIRRLGQQGLVVGLLVIAALAMSSCQADPITLSGHVESTDPLTMPTTNVQVAVYSNVTETLVAETRTVNGDFSFQADELPPGTYRIRFSDAGWWQNATNWQSATPVAAADGATPLETTVDVATATITGYNQVAGKPLRTSSAAAYSAETGAFVGDASSDYSPFELTVPVGSYYIKSGALWNGYSFSHHGANPLVVTAGQTIDLGAIEDAGPVTWSVAGVVTGGETPLSGAKIYIFEAEGGFVLTSTTTNSGGEFKVNVSPNVDYKALVVDPGGSYQPVTWGAPNVTATGGTTFSLPTAPLFGVLDLGTQDLQPVTS